MDERKRRVLMAVVGLYATDGEPVGSQLLSKYLDIRVSSATLRNEMAALTRLGLLEQPHTSAGRVPTVDGYRYYVDNLLGTAQTPSKQDKMAINGIFAQLDLDPEKLTQGAARRLCDWLECTVIATTPQSDDMRIVHFDIVQVGRFAGALLAVTSGGGVRTRVVKTGFELAESDLKRVANVLNRTLRFVAEPDLSLDELINTAGVLGEDSIKLVPFLQGAMVLVAEAAGSTLYVEGQQYLLRWPELRPGLRELMELISNAEALRELLNVPTAHTSIVFGEDLSLPVPGFCLAARRYFAGGGLTGSIALAGPARMRYGEMLPRLEYFSEMMGKSMTGISA